MSEGTSLLTHEFRLAAEYRRCGWYVLLGVTKALGVTAFLKQWGLVRGDGWVSFAICAVVIFLASCGLLYAVYRWRLRVDEMGIARRRLWTWDLWTWDEFESGELKRRGESFTSTVRPWWRSELTFCYLDEKDRAFVLGACRFFFQQLEESPVEFSDAGLLLRYQFFCTVNLRQEGVAGRTGRGNYEFNWSEVQEVRLLYFDHWSTELRKIELDLPNHTLRIEGVNKLTSSSFDALGVTDARVIPNVVADFLHRYVPPEKLARHAIHGPPATLSECEHRRRKLRRELRSVTWCYNTMPLGLLMLTSLCLGPKLFAFWVGPVGLLNVAWLLLMRFLTASILLAHPLMCWGLLREIRNRHAKALRELDAWENENVEQDVTGDRMLLASV